MFTSERRQKIVEILNEKSSATVTELEKQFEVSSETIRRDLLALESEKKLMRVHGGALSITQNMQNKVFTTRHTENIPEKRELSQYAAEFIKDGDVIAIDVGSTAVIFAEVLMEKFQRLTIVTNSLKLFNMFISKKDFEVILCSGEYCREEECFFGYLTKSMIKQLRVSKAFLFPGGVSLKHGITDFYPRLMEIQHAYSEITDKTFILADSSKFESGGMYRNMLLNSDVTVITDSNLSDEIYESFIQADIDIIRGD